MTIYRNSCIVTGPDGNTYQCVAWNGSTRPPPGPGWVKLWRPDELHSATHQEARRASPAAGKGARHSDLSEQRKATHAPTSALAHPRGGGFEKTSTCLRTGGGPTNFTRTAPVRNPDCGGKQ
jgi:hypothetical protein